MNLPNKLTVFRVILIVPFVVLLLGGFQQWGWFTTLFSGILPYTDYIAVAIFIIASLTDLLDGKIARKFNIVTELGKLLDPVADKLTHGALALCLALRYPLMWALILLLIVKEGYMAVMGAVLLKKGKKLNGAMWFGKVCTAVLFAGLLVLFLFPHLPLFWVNSLILGMMAVMIFTLLNYIPIFRQMRREAGGQRGE